MAKNDNIQDFVVDIANAIREKKGTTELINPQNFSDEILSIASSSGEDMLQLLINEKPDCSRLFYKFQGESLEFISKLDMSSVQTLDMAFGSSPNLKKIGYTDTSNVESMNQMCTYCSSLQEFPPFITTKVKNMSYLLNYCSSLTKVHELDLTSCTNASNLCQNCLKLKSIQLKNTNNVTNWSSAFYYSGLTDVGVIDMISATNVSRMFNNCPIEKLTLKNIKLSLVLYSGTNYGNNLTLESLINTLKELWDYSSSSSTYTLTIGDTNISKLSDVYVRLIDVTDEMIAQDSNIASKMPCEVCNSTDEGAMPIITYANNKGWTIA